MSNQRFDFAAPPEALGTSRILYVTTSRFDKDWHSTMHTHGCTELFYCVRGIGEFVLDKVHQSVGGDDLIIINPNVEHTESSAMSNPLEYIVVGIDGLEFQFEGDAEELGYMVLNYRENRDELLFYLRELLSEANAQPQQHEEVCQHILQVLLIKILRGRHLTMTITPVRRGNKECAAARRYIDEHYAESLTLDMLAELAHVNKYYLVHTFNKEYGITPINYLIDRRIRESKYMLSNTNHSLSQIAHVLGFSSPSYFSQSFRKLTGMSPMEYRKRSQKKAENAKI
ncbi:MAG: AraC family transcriptional regulator [Ruthenibacterium sp.]